MSSAFADQPSEILWTYPAGRIEDLPDQLQVTGTKEGGTFKPESLSLPDTPASTHPIRLLPLDTNLLPLFRPRPFGVEERVEVSAEVGGIALSCLAGTQPAGLVLAAERFRFPDAQRAALVVEGHSSAPLAFAVVPEGEDAPAESASPAGEALARIPATDWVPAGKVARQLVVVCPAKAATATITAIRLVVDGRGQEKAAGTWLWDARPWLGKARPLAASLRAETIRDLFLQLRIENGAIADEAKLAVLLEDLPKVGIAVHAVEGDADMASAEGRAHALERARVLRRFAGRTGLIGSFQYDIEAYLRPGFSADTAAGWREWARTIRALADALGGKISVVVPFWMLDSTGGEPALKAASGAIASITVMAYRTDTAKVEQIAGEWLDWGANNDMLISIALENGPIPTEFIRTYARAGQGELVLDRSAVPPVVRILRTPVLGSYTKPTYSFRREVEVDASRISFLDNRDVLAKARKRLGRTLTAWTSFRGLMIHGLVGRGAD